VATVAHGVEVEILAWQPRRAADPRYRVRTTKDGLEGWLEAANLKPIELPPPPARIVPRVEPPPPKRTVARKVPVAPKRRVATGRKR
jgi:hypothetical protein